MITRAVPTEETGSAMSFNQVLRYVGYSTGSALSAATLAAHTPPGHSYPSASGYTVAAFLGVALWLLSLAAGALLPTGRKLAATARDDQLLADESVADAFPDDGFDAERTDGRVPELLRVA
jgi:hypothetical protein